MVLRPETVQFVKDLEAYAGRPLTCRDEVSQLLDLARSSNRMELFEDIVFHAKFVTKAFDVMKRIGPTGEGYEKMGGEFRENVEKVNSLVKTLVKDSPDELKSHFTRRFFGMDQVGLTAFLNLLKDLAWVKNWMVDGRKVP